MKLTCLSLFKIWALLPDLNKRWSSAIVRAGKIKERGLSGPANSLSHLAKRRPSVATTVSLPLANSKKTPFKI